MYVVVYIALCVRRRTINLLSKCFLSFFPDEGALVKGARKLGFSFNVRTPTSVIINVVGIIHLQQ